MALASGTKIGPYEILSPLGAGGMGEVYLARDAKLNRDVALKVLPAAVAQDPERVARFRREAQVLASLNHPNIAHIHGLEEAQGTLALVMELVEGPTLAERIRGSSVGSVHETHLQLEEALHIAKQIADALEFAHERGVIHRDLKPANVKVTSDGAVKVLDFGLAKALDPQVSGSNIANSPTLSPTLSLAATQAGMILGTAAYMSPEQARGKTVDRRSDIWAFGCVLFEMLSGRKPFDGEVVTDVLAAVVRAEPEWKDLPEATPAPIQKLIHRCLVKDPKQRLRDIGEARIAIEETLSGNSGPELAPALLDAAPRPPRGVALRILPWALVVVFAALAASIAVWSNHRPAEAPSSPVLAYIPPPPNTTFRSFGFGAGPVAVSPDGRQLAFSATDENGVTKLWVRPLGSSEAHAVAGAEDAASPFWSPDGGSIGFFANQKLKTVNLANGNVQVLSDAPCANVDGAWSSDGTILFTPKCNDPINKISTSGGGPSPATRIENGERGHWEPAFLPDGRHFLYASTSTTAPISIWMGSLDSSEQKLVLKGASSPQYASGHLFFFIHNGSSVFAQPFDPATGKLSAEATALADAQSYSVSAGGVLAYQGGSRQGRLVWYDRSGNPLGTVGQVGEYSSVRISPDGAHILTKVNDPQAHSSDLWSYPASGGPGARLTFGPGSKSFSAWSPDGKYVAYTCFPDGKLGICRKPADGSGAEEELTTPGSEFIFGAVIDWSPDNRYISTNEYAAKESRYENWIVPLFGDRKQFQVAAIKSGQYDGNFSPDGRWLAYFSYESGRPEDYVVPFPGPGGKFQVSQNGGWNIRWDKKGRLYFLTMGNRLMEADLATSGASLRVKEFHPLFHVNLPSFSDPFFDVSADGSRFLFITSADPNASQFVTVLLDWESKLKGD